MCVRFRVYIYDNSREKSRSLPRLKLHLIAGIIHCIDTEIIGYLININQQLLTNNNQLVVIFKTVGRI